MVLTLDSSFSPKQCMFSTKNKEEEVWSSFARNNLYVITWMFHQILMNSNKVILTAG